MLLQYDLIEFEGTHIRRFASQYNIKCVLYTGAMKIYIPVDNTRNQHLLFVHSEVLPDTVPEKKSNLRDKSKKNNTNEKYTCT